MITRICTHLGLIITFLQAFQKSCFSHPAVMEALNLAELIPQFTVEVEGFFWLNLTSTFLRKRSWSEKILNSSDLEKI